MTDIDLFPKKSGVDTARTLDEAKGILQVQLPDLKVQACGGGLPPEQPKLHPSLATDRGGETESGRSLGNCQLQFVPLVLLYVVEPE